MRVRGGFFKLGKDREQGCQTIGESFFSYFYQKKLKMEKLDGKLLEMLSVDIYACAACT
jgi:hypothetical protein